MRDLAKHAFDKYDEDKSGTLDITELAEVLLHLLPLHNVRNVQSESESDGDCDCDNDTADIQVYI